MAKTKKLFWLSYDLGLKGDYNSLYIWLDSLKAKECGNSIATFWFEYDIDYLKEVESSIKNDVELSKNDRLYLIWREVRSGKNIIKGKFILGKRKPAPWQGYAEGYEDSADEES